MAKAVHSSLVWKVFFSSQLKTKHVFVSSIQKCYCVRTKQRDSLAAEWMVTAHLLVTDVCQCGSGAAVKRKTPYSSSQMFCCPSVLSSSGVFTSPESNCSQISPRSLLLSELSAVSSSVGPDQPSVRLAGNGTASHPARLLTRGVLCARVSAWARGYEESCCTVTGSETIDRGEVSLKLDIRQTFAPKPFTVNALSRADGYDCISCSQWCTIIPHWFWVLGSHDLGAIELKC